MIKYTKEYIAKLLDKYMDGTSTLDEEDILAHYFHSGNVPQEWEDYRQLFSEIEAMKPKRQKDSKRLKSRSHNAGKNSQRHDYCLLAISLWNKKMVPSYILTNEQSI